MYQRLFRMRSVLCMGRNVLLSPIATAMAEAATSTALPDVATSLPPADLDVVDDAAATNTALPDVATSLPPADLDLNDDATVMRMKILIP
jgi:hypothetical protein